MWANSENMVSVQTFKHSPCIWWFYRSPTTLRVDLHLSWSVISKLSMNNGQDPLPIIEPLNLGQEVELSSYSARRVVKPSATELLLLEFTSYGSLDWMMPPLPSIMLHSNFGQKVPEIFRYAPMHLGQAT